MTKSEAKVGVRIRERHPQAQDRKIERVGFDSLGPYVLARGVVSGRETQIRRIERYDVVPAHG